MCGLHHIDCMFVYVAYFEVPRIRLLMYEGELNENIKIAIKIRNTARLSCKLTTMILMV